MEPEALKLFGIVENPITPFNLCCAFYISDLYGLSIPPKSISKVLSIIRFGDNESSCCSVNRQFLTTINVNQKNEEPKDIHSFEFTLGLRDKKSRNTIDKFQTLGITNLRLSKEDILSSVETPKVVHLPFVSGTNNQISPFPLEDDRNRSIRLRKSLSQLLKRNKKRDKRFSPEDSSVTCHDEDDDDDQSILSLDTTFSLNTISSKDYKEKPKKKIGLSRKAYVSIEINSYEQKSYTSSVDRLLDKMTDVLSCDCFFEKDFSKKSSFYD